MGTGELVFVSDAEENVTRVSEIGRVFVSESFAKVKNHSPINVTSASGGSSFETLAVGKVLLHSASGNGIMWWGGTGDDAPYSGHGMPLWGGENTKLIPVTNFNTIRIVASISGQIVYPIGFLNGLDVILPNTVPTIPDTVAPFLISHTPVSGFSGVALNSEITATFSEAISPSSVISGVFRLSPAHNVTLIRDVSDPTKIVMTPNVNLSGSTQYVAEVVSGGVFDTSVNRVATRTTWPFTTTNAPPPPDVIAPVVSGTTPTNGETNVDEDTSPTITFSEAMLSSTMNTTNIFLSTTSGGSANPAAYSVSLSAVDNKTVTIDPTAALAGGQVYYINVTTGAKDLAGNAIAAADRGRNFQTIYNFQEVYNVTGSLESDMYNGDEERFGLQLTNGTSTLANCIVKKITMRLRKDGSPTGTATLRIRSSSDTIRVTFGTLDVSTLSTSFADVNMTLLTNTYTIVNGDRILLEYSGGDVSNKVRLQRLGSNGFSGVELSKWRDDEPGDGYIDDNSQDIAWVIYK